MGKHTTTPDPMDPPGFPTVTVTGTGLAALDRIYGTGHERPVEVLGGSCANVLVSLAMLGHRAAPVLALGEDGPGEALVGELERAGCETRWVERRPDRSSPVIVQLLDMRCAHHRFSFRCPVTAVDLPRWQSIDEDQVSLADGMLRSAAAFYADRLSPAIVRAMESAADAGAIVFFEPVELDEQGLFARAMSTVTFLKMPDGSTHRSAIEAATSARPPPYAIWTHGAEGLTVSHGGEREFFPAVSAHRLVDTCGSGDMVTTGLLDLLLRRRAEDGLWSAADVREGIRVGQCLAALNCAFAGARGLFIALGGRGVRAGIDCGLHREFVDLALTFGPCDGY